jgi:hypothetical protein
MLRTDGGYGVPGMPGNGGVYMAGNPSFDIGPRSPFKGMTREQPGAVGNMGGIQNAQFFGGPQMGQVPPGFQGKYVS